MSSIASTPKRDSRIPWVDVAKGVGIFLVFYGHLMLYFPRSGMPAAVYQMRWVYSFHMPLFFLLVGYLYKDRGLPFEKFVKRQVLTRLVPAWAFNVLAMFMWIAREYAAGASGWVQQYGWPSLIRHCAGETFSVFVQGRPAWNIVTWFLICLFMAELWHFALHRWLRRSGYLLISVVCVGAVVVLMDLYADEIHVVLGARRHWWLATSSAAALWFYQVGILLRRLGWLERGGSTLRLCILAAAFLAASLLTFDRNDPVRGHSVPVVMMVDAFYGNVWWFFVGSLAGTGFIICLSQILSASRMLSYVGRISLVLMCLSGIVHQFANPGLTALIMRATSKPNVILFTLICVVCTALSMLVCLPVNWLLEKYVPFVVGRAGRRRRQLSQPATVRGDAAGLG